MGWAETTDSGGAPSYSLVLAQSTGQSKTNGPSSSPLSVPSTGVAVQYASPPGATLVPSLFHSGEPAGFPSAPVAAETSSAPVLVPIHRAIHAERVEYPWGAGLRIRPASHNVRAGTRWIRRCRWWRTVHGSRWCADVRDAGESPDGAPWVVLDLPRGQSLTQWQQHTVPLQAVVDAVAQAGRWLHAIHQQGWAHHGLHADLLHRTPDGLISVFGWGSVGPVRAARTGRLAFTPGVVEVGFQADIAALARIVLHHLDAPGAPGSASSRGRAGWPGTDRLALRPVLDRAVCPQLSARWPDMSAFVAALDDWLNACPAPRG